MKTPEKIFEEFWAEKMKDYKPNHPERVAIYKKICKHSFLASFEECAKIVKPLDNSH